MDQTWERQLARGEEGGSERKKERDLEREKEVGFSSYVFDSFVAVGLSF